MDSYDSPIASILIGSWLIYFWEKRLKLPGYPSLKFSAVVQFDCRSLISTRFLLKSIVKRNSVVNPVIIAVASRNALILKNFIIQLQTDALIFTLTPTNCQLF